MKRRLTLCLLLATLSSLFLLGGCAALNSLATQPNGANGAGVAPASTQPDAVDKVATAIENGVNLGEKLAKPAQDAGIPYAGLAYGALVAVGSIVSGVVALRHGNQQTTKLENIALKTVPAPLQPIVLPAGVGAG